MIKLGTSQKDRITGFEGTVTGYVQYLTGCNQALVVSKAKPDGSMGESHWIDEQRLTQVGDNVVELDNSKSLGHDKAPPIR